MVVWCCATANTKPRFQPSDDAEYCLYVKFSASAGLATKTSTAHNSHESFATLLPPFTGLLRPAHESNAIIAGGLKEDHRDNSEGLSEPPCSFTPLSNVCCAGFLSAPQTRKAWMIKFRARS